jgi:hypothetical protein
LALTTTFLCRKNGVYIDYTRIHSTAAIDDWHDDDMGGRVVLITLNVGDTLGRNNRQLQHL